MTQKEVKELILWVTEPLPEGAIRFRKGIGGREFLLMDPDLSQRVNEKKVFYTVDDILNIWKEEKEQ